MYKLEEILKKIQNYDNIIIYGAGLVSCAFVEYALANHINITCIAVSDQRGNPKHILGIPIVKAESLRELGDDSIVIVATLENLHGSIENILYELGLRNIIKLSNVHYASLRKKNRDFSMDVLSELYGSRRTQNKTNQLILQKIYNLNQDVRQLTLKNDYICNDNGAVKESIKVSVIIPVYNVENYLTECLNSVINQTMTDYEIICIDDGSTDHSLEILKCFGEKYPFIKIIQKENGGLSAARNTGLDIAYGEYIFFLDSDDCIEERALEEMFEVAYENKLDVLYIDGRVFYESKELEEKYPQFKNTYHRSRPFSQIVRGTELFCNFVEDGSYYVQVSLQFIRRKYLEKVKLRFLEGIIYEDNLFNLQCILQADSVTHRNHPYFIRRIRANSIMTSGKITFKNFYGYFITYIQMVSFAVTFHTDVRTQEIIEWVIQAIYHHMEQCYNYLSDEERNKLEMMTPIEKLALNNFKL